MSIANNSKQTTNNKYITIENFQKKVPFKSFAVRSSRSPDLHKKRTELSRRWPLQRMLK